MVTMAISIALHLAVLAGVGWRLAAPPLAEPRSFDVTLVSRQTAKTPDKADLVAQRSFDGGGNTDDRRAPLAARAPRPAESAVPQAAPPAAPAEARPVPRSHADRVLSKPAAPVRVPVEAGRLPDVPAASFDTGRLLADARALARADGEIAETFDARSSAPRRAVIGGRIREAKFARYAEDWRMKIERIGNLNYPQAARDQGLYGRLVLAVDINADGSLRSVRIERGSGHAELDDAATRIVRLAAPFSPFPDEIRRDYEVLTLVRTWTFSRENQLAAR